MIHLDLKALLGKLNDSSRKTLEAAAGLCLSRTHYDVELEHWFLKLIETPKTDVEQIIRHFGLNADRLARDLTAGLEKLKTGNARTPAFSTRITALIRDAWSLASLNFQNEKIRSGHLLLTLLTSEGLLGIAREMSGEFALVSPETLRNKFYDIVAGSEEDRQETPPAKGTASSAPGVSAKTPALDQFTINLTERAQKGGIDPVLGRDAEVRQMIDILTRRRKNNPILLGEAGVGKTAVVEGFALKIAAADVPPSLRNVSLRLLDLALLQAGAGIKGEFENRLKSVIQEVKASLQPIILFIDEAHTMIGAGGPAGQGDAANLLKPALARGELRTIAATTWGEYKKYIEKDPALERRFEPVVVAEPAEEAAIRMMRGLLPTLEKHHGVRILDEAVEEAVRLSHRYITGRQLPDKCLGVLDTACARVAIGHSAVPGPLEDCQRQIEQITAEIGILQREKITGGNHQERLDELEAGKKCQEERRVKLEAQWQQEKEIVGRLRQIRETLEARSRENDSKNPAANDKEIRQSQKQLQQLTQNLREIQGKTPLLHVQVDGGIIAEVISEWTGIPVGKMLTDELQTVLNLRGSLEKRIVGQSQALEAISQRIRTARAGLEDPRKPTGVFLLVGPSGTGKTLTALTLAEELYGGERKLITINMSEYQEPHTVSGLKGSPAGYVGYGEGGILTEAVRRNPYCVLLLDEIEKAHRDVQELFYQVFDKGEMKDAEGRLINFKNTVIFLTSNIGSEIIMKLCADEDTAPGPEKLVEAIRPELLKKFEPAFLGRTILVPYYPISDKVMKQIVVLELEKIRRRLAENRQVEFSYDDALVEQIAGRCTEVETGARNVDHILTRTLLPEISQEFLTRMAVNTKINKIHITTKADGDFEYKFF